MSSIITIVVLIIVLLIAVGFIIKSQKEQKKQLELKRLQVIQSKTMSKKNKVYTPGNPESPHWPECSNRAPWCSGRAPAGRWR